MLKALSARLVQAPGLKPIAIAGSAGAARLARSLAMIAAGALMLLAAIAINGRPAVFPDTDDYFMEGHSIARVASALVNEGKPPITEQMIIDHFGTDSRGDEEPIHNQDGARSAYYGAFLYLAHRLGTVWLAAALQAALTASLLFALWRLAAPAAARWTYLAAMGVLSIGSTLPFVAGFTMPDALTGVAALAVTIILLYWERLTLGGRIALWVTLAFAANAHPSHILLAFAMLGVGAPLALALRMPARVFLRRAGLIAAAAAVAVAANAAYAFAVHLRSGDDLRSPPFLTVRVLADGPGRSYLRAKCGRGLNIALCRFRNLPLDDTNDMLWSDDPTVGIFNAADYQLRERLEREELGFVVGAIAHDPLGQIGASLKNWAVQFFDITLEELLVDPAYYLNDPYWSTTNLPTLILGPGSCGGHGTRCAPRISEVALRLTHWFVIAVGFGFLAWRGSRADVLQILARRELADARTRVLAAILLLVLAVVLNSAICGAISGPFGRYQARIVWLIPTAAMLAAAAFGVRGQTRAAR